MVTALAQDGSQILDLSAGRFMLEDDCREFEEQERVTEVESAGIIAVLSEIYYSYNINDSLGKLISTLDRFQRSISSHYQLA